MLYQSITVLEQTHKIADGVRDSNWDLVSELLVKRQETLENLFSESIPLEYSESVSEMIHEVLLIDSGLVDIIKKEQVLAVTELRDMLKINKVDNTYRNIAELVG